MNADVVLHGASAYIWNVAHAIHGENSDIDKRWAQHRLDQLWTGELDPLLRALQRHAAHQSVRDTISYFENNRSRMDYPRYRKMGFQISGGVIESGCKHIIDHRLRQAGIRWPKEDAQAVAKLRARLKGGR